MGDKVDPLLELAVWGNLDRLSDYSLILLNGHIFLEKIIEIALKRMGDPDPEKLSFYSKVIRLKHLLGQSTQSDSIIYSLTELNRLRNKLAQFCGRDKLVDRLIRSGAEIDGQDKTHNSTPLGWAIHSLQSNDTVNKFHQVECIKLLLQHGAETKKLDKGKNDYLQLMVKNDLELQTLMN